MIGTRVLKAHTEAVKAALGEAAEAVKSDGLEGFARVMAQAVITAEDGHKTRYVVCVKDGTELYVYGTYATFAAAKKALDQGSLGFTEGSRAGVFPLIPAPKAIRPTTPKKEK